MPIDKGERRTAVGTKRGAGGSQHFSATEAQALFHFVYLRVLNRSKYLPCHLVVVQDTSDILRIQAFEDVCDEKLFADSVHMV
jgi:hypothetical protein